MEAALSAEEPDLDALRLAQERALLRVVYALLLDADATVQDRQHAEIGARLGRDRAVMAKALRDEQLAGLHPMLRLPLASLCFPVLCRRPRPEMSRVLDTLHAVVNTDARVSVFEYCLGTLLKQQLRASLDPGAGAEGYRLRYVESRLDATGGKHRSKVRTVCGKHARRRWHPPIPKQLAERPLFSTGAVGLDGHPARPARSRNIDVLDPAGTQ